MNMNIETVLIVDDEPLILRAISRLLADTGYKVLTAADAMEGLEIVQQNDISLVLSDNCMPGKSGIEFLTQVKLLSPSTQRILMTAHADVDMAVKAINQGEIFRFIIKPWDNDYLLNAIQDSLMHNRLVSTLKQGEESVYLTMARMVELKDPYTHGHCQRVAEISLLLAEKLGLNSAIMDDIRWGGWLHDCGKVGVPEKILNFPGKLSPEEFEIIKKHSEWGASVVSQAGFSRTVVNIVLYHHEHFSGTGYPFGLSGKQIPIEARIAAVADVYDALSTDRPYRPAFTTDKLLAVLNDMRGSVLDPDLLDLLIASQERFDPKNMVTPAAQVN